MVGVRPVEVRCDIHDVRIRLANWMIIEMPQNRRIGLAIREVGRLGREAGRVACHARDPKFVEARGPHLLLVRNAWPSVDPARCRARLREPETSIDETTNRGPVVIQGIMRRRWRVRETVPAAWYRVRSPGPNKQTSKRTTSGPHLDSGIGKADRGCNDRPSTSNLCAALA